jgi:UTP--glucose-1-phosphate uridylyltransferase
MILNVDVAINPIGPITKDLRSNMSRRIHSAILPVAGLGTRLLPATKSVPKELMPVYDRPVIQLVIDEARAAGIRRLVFVTHPSKSAIEEYIRADHPIAAQLQERGKTQLAAQLDALSPEEDMEVVFVTQDEPRGLGHAVLCAREAVGPGPVAVMLPDDVVLGDQPTIGQMAQQFDPGMCDHMVATMEVPRTETAKYGIVEAEKPAAGRHVEITGMVEKPSPDQAPSELAVIGRYILSPSIFDVLAETPPGAGGEIQLTDAIADAIGKGGVSAFRITGERFDCGDHDGLLEASIACRKRRLRPGLAA